jgi:membrane protease YdiL (CAAX protease family)
MPWTGSYLAGALPVAGVFGFLHAYQGRHGIVRTTAVGVVMAAGVAWTGSLWPSILAHAALDLLFGLVLSKSLVGEPRALAAREGASWT